MTKKDYIKIAGVIRGTRFTYGSNAEVNAWKCLDDLALAIAEMLKRDNPEFKKETFISFIQD